MSEMPLHFDRQARIAIGRQLAALYEEAMQAPLPPSIREVLDALGGEAAKRIKRR